MRFFKYINSIPETPDGDVFKTGDVIMVRKGMGTSNSPYYWNQYKVIADGSLSFVKGVTDDQALKIDSISHEDINKLKLSYTNQEIDNKVNSAISMSTSSYYPLPSGVTVLPKPPLANGQPMPSAWVFINPGVIYTQPGGPSISGVLGHDNRAQWDGSQWSLVDLGEVVSSKIEDWLAMSYAKGDQVFYDKNIYEASQNTLADDIPGSSSRWVEKTGGMKLDVSGGAASYDSIVNNGVNGVPYEAGYLDFLINTFVTLAGVNQADNGWRASKKQPVKKGQKVIAELYGNSVNGPAIVFTRDIGSALPILFQSINPNKYKAIVDVPFDGFVQVNTLANAPRDAFIKITSGSIFLAEEDIDSESGVSVVSTSRFYQSEGKWNIPTDFKNVYYDLTWEQGRIIQQNNRVVKSNTGEALSWRVSEFMQVNKGDIIKINLKGHIAGVPIAIAFFTDSNIDAYRNNLLLYSLDLVNPNEFWGGVGGTDFYPTQFRAEVIVPQDGYVAFNTHLSSTASNDGQAIYIVDKWATESPRKIDKRLDYKDTKAVPSVREVFVKRPKFMRLDLYSLLPNQGGRNLTTGELAFSENGIEFLRVIADTNIQGHGSAAYPKKGYNFDFWNNADKGLKVNFGNWIPSDTYHLKAHQTDRTHSRDVASGRWWRDMVRLNIYPASEVTNKPYAAGQNEGMNTLYTAEATYHTDGVPCELYVHNSEMIGDSGVYGDPHFMGLYTFRLKKRRENYSLDNTNLNHIFLDSSTMNAYMNRPFNPANWDVKSPKMEGYEEAGPIPVPEVQAKCERLFNWLSDLQNRHAEHEDFIILPLWIDYIIFCEIIGHWDANGNNTNLQTWDGDTWAITPYDMDNIMGLDPRTGGQGNFKFSVTQSGEIMNFDIWPRFKTAYTLQIKDRYNFLRDIGFLTTANIFKYYKDLTAPIPRSVYWKDKERWSSLFATIPTIQQVGMYLESRIAYMDSVWRL